MGVLDQLSLNNIPSTYNTYIFRYRKVHFCKLSIFYVLNNNDLMTRLNTFGVLPVNLVNFINELLKKKIENIAKDENLTCICLFNSLNLGLADTLIHHNNITYPYPSTLSFPNKYLHNMYYIHHKIPIESKMLSVSGSNTFKKY